MQVTAKLRHLRMSPRKVRLVADMIRGQDVSSVEKQLNFINKKATRPILKLLNSAIANAENNFKLKKDSLYISELRVDAGPILKRWRPRAMGRAAPINKRTSHISIILDEKAISETKKEVEDISEKKKKKDKKNIDKDVKVLKSLDEVKELEKVKEKAPTQKVGLPAGEAGVSTGNIGKSKGAKEEIHDVRREGSDRRKQHLDAVKKKGKGGILKKMFRRKSI